jgi:hypothetical protein
MNINKEYHKNVVKTWTWDLYHRYKHSPWRWADLPFRDHITNQNLNHSEFFDKKITKRIENISILEVGSAMGSAYKFLKNSGLIDLSNYTGVEVSQIGHDYCKKNYPNANWLHKDFTKWGEIGKYDYTFERNGIHHMPNPIRQYEKMLKSTKISFITCFRSSLVGETIADMEVSNFKTDTGIYFSSIINLFELIELGIELGFKNIKIVFGGAHEKISTNPESPFFLSDKINPDKIFLSRCRVLMIKSNFKGKPKFRFVVRPDNLIRNFKACVLIKKTLEEIRSKF